LLRTTHLLLDDRGREGSRLPALRTVRAVVPHTALQLLVSSSGVSRVLCVEGEQPLIGEEDIWPLVVVSLASSHRPPAVLFAQDGAQTSPDDLIKPAEQARSGMHEVAKPPPQRPGWQ
jgi:hypothetical protein